MKRTLCLLLSALLLLTSAVFTVSAVDVTATVDGSAINSGDTIPAVSEIVFTLPYTLSSGQVEANVVLTESTKTTTVTWNTREFDDYTLAGDQLTIPFALGDLAMNGDYKFTFKDPAGAGSDVEFSFKTSASDGYVMYDNFSRYPAGSVPKTTEYYPYATGYQTANTNSYSQIVDLGNGNKALRLSIGAAVALENTMFYRSAFSAPITGSSVEGTTEVEFQLAALDHKTIYSFGGVGIVAASDTSYDIYAYTSYHTLNSTSMFFRDADWTLIDTVNFGSKAERDAKHTLSYTTITNTTSYDNRTLEKVVFDGVELASPNSMAMASGNHTAVYHSLLFSNGGSYANANSTFFMLLNTWSGSEKGGYVDIYSLSYAPKAPVMELSVSDSSQFPINGGVAISFDEAPTPTSGTVKSILEDNIVVKKGSSTITGWTLTENNSTSYLLTAPFENNKKYSVTIPDIFYGERLVKGDTINFTTDWKQLEVDLAGSATEPELDLPASSATTGTISLTIPADTYELTNLKNSNVSYQAVLALYRRDGQSPAKQVDEVVLSAETVPAAGATVPAISVSYTDEEYDATTVKYFAKLFFISDDDIAEAIALAEPVVFGTPISQGTDTNASFSVVADTDTAILTIEGTYGSYTNYENRALWVTAINDNGSDVFYDQLSSGTNGEYTLSLVVDPQRDSVSGAYYNEYTVTVVPPQGYDFAEEDYAEFDFDNVKPSADPSNMTISDNGTTDPANRTITATYVYFDALKRPEAGTTVTWKYADTATATTWTTVAGDATDDTTLAVTEELVGKYITCVIVPKNAAISGVEYNYLDDNSHDALLVENLAPQVDSMDVDNVDDRKLTVTYTLEDPLATDRTSDTSEIKWYIADTENGTYSEITETLTNPAELPLLVDYAGKYIKCAVIPQYNSGAVYWDTGREYDSKVDFSIDPYYVKYRPVFKNLTITQDDNTITVDITLNDPLGHEADTPEITWTFKDGDTVVRTISGTPVQTSYSVSKADKGLTLIVTAIPKIKVNTCDAGSSCTDIAVGDPAETTPLTITYKSTGVGDSFGGGGGGGGIGGVKAPGAGNPEQKPSAPAYQSPEGSASAGSVDFPDVRGHWAEKEIFELYDAGVVNGRSENAFEPNGRITRAEFLAILVRAMGLESVADGGDFADVKAGDWYAGILATAKANGIFEGSEGNAYPNRAISREEMVTIIVRAYEKCCGEIKVGGGLLNFTDASAISGWAQSAVIKASEIALVNGTEDGSFAPKANTTRAESAVIIVRFIPHLEKAAEAKAEAEKKAAEEAAKAAEEAAKAAEEAAKAEADATVTEEETTEETVEETVEETTEAGAEEAPATEE